MTDKTYLLDTNIWISLLRGNEQVQRCLSGLNPDQLRLSLIVRGELETGFHLGGGGKHRRHALDRVYSLTRANPFNCEIANRFGALRAHLRAAGHPIGHNDCWIAAEALHHGQVVVTANTREFTRVPGLTVENWLS